MMFEFTIEINYEDLQSGIDGFCRGNIAIKSQYGSTDLKGEKMLIFISLTDLLLNIIDLVDRGVKKYKFNSFEGGFVFYLNARDKYFELENYRGSIIAKPTSKELIQSIGRGVINFYNTYRPMVKEVDSAIEDFDETLETFKTLYSDLLNITSDKAESLPSLLEKDLIVNHISQSEQQMRQRMANDKIRFGSSFFDPPLAKYIEMVVTHRYELDIVSWLQNDTKIPLTKDIYTPKWCGYFIKNNRVIRTKRALVILVKDDSDKGYRVLTSYPAIELHPFDDESFDLSLIMTPYQLNAKTELLFSGYFHQDWVHCYNWDEGEAIDFKKPIEKLKQDASVEDLALAVQKLNKIVSSNWSEESLKITLIEDFNCFINPEAFGLSERQFIEAVLNEMKKGGKYLLNKQSHLL